MSHRLAHLAQRLFNTPLAVHPRKAEIVVAALAERLGIVSLDSMAPRSVAYYDDDDLAAPHERRDHAYENLGGVAVIPVEGTLVNKSGTLAPSSGICGYDGIRQNFLVALNDPAVKAIALDIESGGGEVSGCFDLCDTIYQARGTKPTHAILSEYAYSAAFALASACDHISVPRTGSAGSVGVICMHVDYSQAIKDAGIKVNFITYGDRKSEGRPELPLDAETRTRWQAVVDEQGEMFVDLVSRNLGMSAKAVRATQAGTFMGAEAVKVGFAHAVASPDAAFRALVKSLK